ncbi:hypothetical protein HOY80DRAFT_1043818 [Tuber brumale]|nr:hypothetical protein HOY80DRAFT_1043818 [Tuber brumale]
MDDVELGEAEPTTYLSSPSSESHIVEESSLRERHPDILSALSDDADVTVDDGLGMRLDDTVVGRLSSSSCRQDVFVARPSSEDQSHYIVTAPTVADDQNFVLPTWQVIRPGHHRLGNVGAPADAMTSEYEERKHLRYHPLIRVNTLSINFHLTWRRPIYIRVICFSQQTLEAPRWNVFHRLLTPPNNTPPPAPNLVGIAPVGRAGARNLLKVIDGPLLYTQEEREQEWIGFAAKNKRFNRHIYYDSGPILLKCSAGGTIREKSFRFTTHPRRCYVTNERTPFSDLVTQPDTNLIEQGIVGGVEQPLGALAKIHRFHGFVGWSEMPFE